MSNVPKVTVFVANILFLVCIPFRFAQLYDGELDDDGCWPQPEGAEGAHHVDGHGSTLGPRLARLTTARAGGKAKIGSGGGKKDDDDEDEPSYFLPPCSYRQWEELLLIWAIPMTWFYLIFFAG